MVFILSCIQPPEEAQTAPLFPNSRSEADGGAGHPPVSSLPRPPLLFQVLLISHSTCGNAALGLMWYSMSQIAAGGDCNQLGETVETLRVLVIVSGACTEKVYGCTAADVTDAFCADWFIARLIESQQGRTYRWADENQTTYLSGPLTVGELFLLKPSFSLCRSTLWVSTHPAYTAVSLTIEQAYLANQKPFWTATLDIFVAVNGVMGSMWCGLQRSNWITSSADTKGLWSQTDHHKDQTVLFLCLYWHHSGTHWLDVHQSAGFVADSFIDAA